jgi:transcriptional regulator with XRE-family HTH domain/GTPase SAR1 family protein
MKTDMHYGQTIQHLRETAGLSQTQLAKQLPFTASRISRIETGELGLSDEEARELAKAIGTEPAKAFAEYLGWQWRILEAPGFEHISREVLWKAEQAMQRLTELTDDPDLKNAFLKQIESCRQALERAASFLLSTEHSVVFIGSPGVGKTTVICGLSEGLRDLGEDDLKQQMTLPTGAGRTTICEVQVRRGGEFGIVVEPCSEDEVRYHVADFCDYLLSLDASESSDAPKDGAGIAAEMVRTFRNMTGLTIKRVKEPGGKDRREDPAIDLVRAYPDRDELQIQVLSRLNLPQRRRTSISYPRASSVPCGKWLADISKGINLGKNPEFPLPRRIEISVPHAVLQADALDIRLIDTRGIDEPSALRRDLQAYLDEERAVIVLCSGFTDAPSAAVQAVIERAGEAGLRKTLLERGTLLILPRDGVETAMQNENGEPVSDAEEGRDIRREQVQTTTFTDLGFRDLPIEFLDVREEHDCDRAREFLVGLVTNLRRRAEDRVLALTATVEQLIENKADAQARAIFEQATKPLRTWFASNRKITAKPRPVQGALLDEIDAVRYASSLRASVNRYGSWHNFDFWHGLGFGARREAFARATNQMIELKGIIKTALNDSDLADAHRFLTHFQAQVEESASGFFLDIQQLGESAFADQLRADHAYWEQRQQRWGMGPGYKHDIRSSTKDWFLDKSREARHEFVEKEIQRRWQELTERLAQQLETADGKSVSIPA